MQVCDLIEELRRFPQSATVLLCDRLIFVDVSPMENAHGMSVFDACCADRELPDQLRKRCPDCGYTEDDARLHGDHHRCGNFPFFGGERIL